MNQPGQQRKLAAIVFTDIEGYTSMMQSDEQLGLGAARRHQKVMEQCVSAHGGEVYQFYGDGCLSIFSSATDAVSCALTFQKQFLEAPELPVRTGIHIGEIYIEDGKLFGDGVNLASRIESIGQPGTILFSREVAEKIRNHKEFQIQLLGKFHFKNIDQPKEIYSLINPEIRTPDRKKVSGKLKVRKSRFSPFWVIGLIAIFIIGGIGFKLSGVFGHKSSDFSALESKKSIAVLPFENLSEVGEEEYLSAGIAEDIITQLSKISGLKVISRSSSSHFTNTVTPLNSIAKELGVANILQGSVRKYQNMIRITVQLVDPMNGSLLWAGDYDRELADILLVQRDVAMAVTDELKVKLSSTERFSFEKLKPVNPEAYLLYQQGQGHLKQSSGTTRELEAALEFFRRAVEVDSEFSLAYTGIADTYLEYLFWHRADETQMIALARKEALRALEIDPNMGEAYGVLGSADWAEKKLSSAIEYLNKAIELSPSYALAYERLAWCEMFNGNESRYLELINMALELDPLSNRFKGSKCTYYYHSRKFDEGIKLCKKYLEQTPEDNFLLWTLGYLYAGKGDYENAIKALEKREIGKTTNWLLGFCYSKTGDMERAGDILQYNMEKAKSNYVPHFMLATQYLGIGFKEEALDQLQQGISFGNEGFFYYNLKTDPLWKEMWRDPEFKRLAKKAESYH